MLFSFSSAPVLFSTTSFPAATVFSFDKPNVCYYFSLMTEIYIYFLHSTAKKTNPKHIHSAGPLCFHFLVFSVSICVLTPLHFIIDLNNNTTEKQRVTMNCGNTVLLFCPMNFLCVHRFLDGKEVQKQRLKLAIVNHCCGVEINHVTHLLAPS